MTTRRGAPLRVGSAFEDAATDERGLVERVQRGDRDAFGTLARLHMRRAFVVAYRILGNREDAEDLVQDAFIAALDRIDTFELGRPFAPWFLRIVTNRGLNARKSRALRETESIPETVAGTAPSPHRLTEQAEARERLARAMARLSERQRLVVQLFELDGFATPEIAEMLDIAEGTVRWTLHEARKALRAATASTYGKGPTDDGRANRSTGPRDAGRARPRRGARRTDARGGRRTSRGACGLE